MVLTDKQEQGLKIAVNRYKNSEKYTCISGYAGTGKSTLIKFIISALNVDPEKDVCYVAFTGKAATVLKQKGCPNAITAHKLLYDSYPKPDGTFSHREKRTLDYPYKIIVVDEISMLPNKMWLTLLRHPVYILAVGDPGQLPPLPPKAGEEETNNHVLDNPHIFLDEIMRQAQDSEIIRLSMHVREGLSLRDFPCAQEEVQIFKPHQVVDGMYLWADQILCATNAKKNQINNFVRKQLGYGEEPCIGDKIICRENHWDRLSIADEWALTNGAIGTISKFNVEKIGYPSYICNTQVDYMYTDMRFEEANDDFIALPIDYKKLTTDTSALTGPQIYRVNGFANKGKCAPAPYEFNYAYAITTHKAQGSEWDKILVFEENFPFQNEEHKRWLYTAITRASKKLVIVTKS